MYIMIFSIICLISAGNIDCEAVLMYTHSMSLHPNFVYASSEGSDESVHIR